MIFSIPLNSIYNRHTNATYLLLYIYIHQDLHDRSLLFQVFPTARLLWRNRALHWWTTTSWRTSRGPCGRTGAGGICSWSKTWVATPFECMATWPAMLSAGTATKPFVVLFSGMVKATIFGCGCCGCGCGGCGCGGCGGYLRHHKRGHGHGPMFSVFKVGV